jgi:hypothetical protein
VVVGLSCAESRFGLNGLPTPDENLTYIISGYPSFPSYK